MPRHSLLLGALLAATLLVANGCRSCSSCHDYDSPVKNCHCGHCPQCGCNGGSACGCSGGSGSSSTVIERGDTKDGKVVEGVPADGRMYPPRDSQSN